MALSFAFLPSAYFGPAVGFCLVILIRPWYCIYIIHVSDFYIFYQENGKSSISQCKMNYFYPTDLPECRFR